MLVRLHSQATTTPKIRAAIQASASGKNIAISATMGLIKRETIARFSIELEIVCLIKFFLS
jgi:hypothetical protein